MPLYTVHHSNGRAYDVETDKHHSQHPEADFKQHLLKIIEGAVSGVIAGYVTHFTLKRH